MTSDTGPDFDEFVPIMWVEIENTRKDNINKLLVLEK